MFDGEKFARVAYDLGAEYVVFTVCHAGFNLLYPSEVMRPLCPQKCTERSDAIRKLIDGLSKYDIPLVLYMPPNDECDITEGDLKKLGWFDDPAGKAPTDARNLYRYTVRTIAVEGQFNAGIAWSCGPYLDQSWEEGVCDLLSGLGGMLRAHEGIYGTVPGRSYTEAPNAVLDENMWGVSTESPDGETVYLHVLNRPADGVLKLPVAADGKSFREARYKDMRLELAVGPDGYAVTLPDEDDGVDTVIRLLV